MSRAPGGSTDLTALLSDLRPVVLPGEFVFVCLDEPARPEARATVLEREGFTHVVERGVAEERGWAYEGGMTWITLEVHSSLAAVGLTAAVSGALAAQGIACNVIAGFHHDHLLVPAGRAGDALGVLRSLSPPIGPAPQHPEG